MIDVSTGDIVWKLSGEPTGKSLAIVGDPNNGFAAQHDIRSLGDGTVTLYDNETGRSLLPRAVRYSIDEEAKTATLVEQATNYAIATSVCCGSARKLATGNWVIGWGGRSLITEQTMAGDTVFSLAFANGLFSYRTQPVTSGLSAAALRAGMDAQYPRPVTREEEPDAAVPSPSVGAGTGKTSSDTSPPVFRVTARTVQRILKQRGLLVEVGCATEACTARARGGFSVRAGARMFKLRTAKAQVSEGGQAKLMLRISKTARKALRRALKKHGAIHAKVNISVRDAAGNSAQKERTFKLRR
jgi:hypothetical protein